MSDTTATSAFPSTEKLLELQRQLHALIRSRAESLIEKNQVTLPDISSLRVQKSQEWFPVPGMFGGFAYSIEERDADWILVVESWCRVVEGSGQRHEVTSQGFTLVEEGFV